jgi:hypothetical protein
MGQKHFSRGETLAARLKLCPSKIKTFPGSKLGILSQTYFTVTVSSCAPLTT